MRRGRTAFGDSRRRERNAQVSRVLLRRAAVQHARHGRAGHSAGDLAIDDFSDKEIAEVREQCDAFLQSPGLFETVLVGVAAVAVTIVNSMLKMIIKAISSFERPASFIELQKKVAEKVFVAQFFNTAVSSLVINAALPELVAGIPILSSTVFNGTHRDFDQSWYQQIGGPLMITMLINTVGPIGGNLRRRARRRRESRRPPNTRRGRNANSTKPTPAPSSTSPRVTAKFSCA